MSSRITWTKPQTTDDTGTLGQNPARYYDVQQKQFGAGCGGVPVRYVPTIKNWLAKWRAQTNYNTGRYETPSSCTAGGWTGLDETIARAFVAYWNANFAGKPNPGGGTYGVIFQGLVLGVDVSTVLNLGFYELLKYWVSINTSPPGSYAAANPPQAPFYVAGAEEESGCAPCKTPAIPRGMPWGASQSPYVAYGRASNPERTPISDNTAIATRLTWLAGTGVGDAAACQDIQNNIDSQQQALSALKQSRNDAAKAKEGALAVNDQATVALLSAQINELDTLIAQNQANLNSLKKMKTDCMAPPAACDTTAECPAGQVCVEGQCVTPNTPPPTKTTTKSSGSDWGIILLSIGAIGGIIKAFS